VYCALAIFVNISATMRPKLWKLFLMARIEEISVKNYRVLQNISLKDIKPFSVFLGINGSGKTTFFADFD